MAAIGDVSQKNALMKSVINCTDPRRFEKRNTEVSMSRIPKEKRLSRWKAVNGANDSS